MNRISLLWVSLFGVTAWASGTKNLVIISVEDVGMSDFGLGAFGESTSVTPHFDSFLSSDSISLSSHYVGYSGSVSKSQLLSGIHSFYNGYHLVSSFVDSFDHGMIAGIPLSYKLLPQYLKESNDDFNTFYVGNWGLGYSVSQQLPLQRGFDYFYGMYTNENDVKTKTSSASMKKTDPQFIKHKNDEQYQDFWQNDELIDSKIASQHDSNFQFSQKASEIIKEHSSSLSPFYLHVSFQGPEQYQNYLFEDKNEACMNVENLNRRSLCLYMAHLDAWIETIVSSLKSSNVWDETLLLVLGSNGGSLKLGSCNFPFRGGKHSMFDGNVKSLALISGGVVPSAKRGTTLNGLFSNVDWVPTLLSHLNAIDSDGAGQYFYELDGVNMEKYLFGTSGPLRDHVMLHIRSYGLDNEGYIDTSLNYQRLWGFGGNNIVDSTDVQYYYETLEEIAMVFYDDDGKLWKFFVTNDNLDLENKYGLDSDELLSGLNVEYNWCVLGDKGEYIVGEENNGVGVLSGLFDLSTDVSEQENQLFTISRNDFHELKMIIKEKAELYLQNLVIGSYTNQLDRNYDCFFKRNNILAHPGTRSEQAWKPFFSSLHEYSKFLSAECGWLEENALYTVHSAVASDARTEFTDLSDYASKEMHTRVPEKTAHVASETITLDAIEAKANAAAEETVSIADTTFVYSDCYGLGDGYYYIQIGGDTSKPILKMKCSSGYMLLDPSFDSNVEDYFFSWHVSHYQVASPVKTDAVNWREWFLPDSGETDYNYIISPECDTCVEGSLFQMHDTKTTYWENAVNSYCATNARGQPAGDAKWQSYLCRQSVYGGLYYDASPRLIRFATYVGDWSTTDMNGIDKETLLTSLSGGQDGAGTAGTCMTLKLAADNNVFSSVEECSIADGDGNLPTLGTRGKYCVCARQTSEKATKRPLGKKEKIALEAPTAEDEEETQLDQNKIFYLHQKDFLSGTYKITEPGTYVIMEDIVFDFNAPDYESDASYSANRVYSDAGDLYWYPKTSQKEEYPGAYEFHDAYLLGFFAGITVECDDVVIDLNEHSLTMDERFFYQQPFWSHIELSSQPFVPGEGPSHFGANPKYVSNVEIKNGVLGLTSHHCVHGTVPEASLMKNIVIRDVVCKDFTTHGIQINGFNGLTIENVEIGPNANMQHLTVDYSQMRTLLPRFEYFADFYGDSKTFLFGGKPSDEYIHLYDLAGKVSLSNNYDYTLREILDEMIEQMDMAFDFVTNRKSEEELKEENFVRWTQAKRVFVETEQGGVPYGGVIYGLYINYPSSGISGFYRNSDKSYNVDITNLYIHDISHSSREEAYLLKSMRSIFALPIVARFWGGEYMVTNFNSIDDDTERVYYYGTIVYDWLVAFYDILKDDVTNVEATNLLYFDDTAINWANGQLEIYGSDDLTDKYGMTCNGDPMFHSVKGIFGLRLTNVEDAVLTDVHVENLIEYSPIGSDVCGSYEKSHDIQQQLPYLYGFTGNNIHGVCVLGSDVLFSNLQVSNLNSLTGNTTGLTIYPKSDVVFDGENNVFSTILSGTQFSHYSVSYDELDGYITSPNQLPRACAIKMENFEDDRAGISVRSLPFSSDTESDNKNEFQTIVNFECISGYIGCNEAEMSGWTDFGDVTISDEIVKECDDALVSNMIESGVRHIEPRMENYVPLLAVEDSETSASGLKMLMDRLTDGLVIHQKYDEDSRKSESVVERKSKTENIADSTNSKMILVMISVILMAVFALICAATHSMYVQKKFGAMEAERNGYVKI